MVSGDSGFEARACEGSGVGERVGTDEVAVRSKNGVSEGFMVGSGLGTGVRVAHPERKMEMGMQYRKMFRMGGPRGDGL